MKRLVGVKENNTQSSIGAPPIKSKTAVISPQGCSKGKGAPTESNEEDCGRAKMPKSTELSAGSSSTGSPPSSASSSGSSTRTGSSRGSRSPSASSRSASYSASRSSGSSSSWGSQTLLTADMTTGGAPAPNPNHLKDKKRRGKGKALRLILPMSHSGAYQESDQGSHRGDIFHPWEN